MFNDKQFKHSGVTLHIHASGSVGDKTLLCQLELHPSVTCCVEFAETGLLGPNLCATVCGCYRSTTSVAVYGLLLMHLLIRFNSLVICCLVCSHLASSAGADYVRSVVLCDSTDSAALWIRPISPALTIKMEERALCYLSLELALTCLQPV